MKNRIAWIVIFTVFITGTQAQKNDTIYLKNGDRITGELKKFEYGLLSLSTNTMQTVTIEFDKINSIYSAKQFVVRTSSGNRYFGYLLKSNTPATVNIVTDSDTIPKPLLDIVVITRIKRSFFQKIDGSLDVGLSYTKASDIFQYSVNAQVIHRPRNYATRLDLRSMLTDDSGGDVTRNNDVELSVTRFLPKNWFTRVSAKGQQNTELDLDLRLQAGFGAGYDVVRTNSIRLYSLAGLIANREKTIDSSIVSNNIEALLSVQLKWFQYRQPKIDVTSGFDFYPSITVSDRLRYEYEIVAKFEIVKDFFYSIQFYDNFDNKPSANELPQNDWSIVTSIGFTF